MVDLNQLLRRESGFVGKLWSLRQDDGIGVGEQPFVLSGQFAPQDYSENAGAKIPDVSTVNNQEPFPQWVGGEGETTSFTARIFRPDPGNSGSVRQDIESLKRATKKDPKLFRAPKFIFSYGEEISFQCFVVSVGGIRYDEITNNGLVKGAQFSIVLRKLENIPQQGRTKLQDLSGLGSAIRGFAQDIGENVANLVNIFGGSLHTKGKTIKAKEGDTFESIAKLEYGDALVGDILRRAQPEKANLQPGDNVILINDTEIFQVEVTPQAGPLKRNSTSAAVRQAKFEERNRRIAKVF